MGSEGWALRQRARLNLLRAQNCAHATLLSMEDVFCNRDPVLMRAATNLEGGVVGCGETCGVVSAGVLAIGGLLSTAGYQSPRAREQAIQRVAASYKSWFEGRFGTSLCRERVQVDFSTARGLLRYLIPGDRLLRCLEHIGLAAGFLTERLREELSAANKRESAREEKGEQAGGGPGEPHCTFTVLKMVYPEQIGFTDSLRWATTGLAGGIALTGAVCGALLGGILAIGLKYGYDARVTSRAALTAAFIRGHWNLLRHRHPGPPPREAFATSRFLAERFQRQFGSMRCEEISSRSFASAEDLRSFLESSLQCGEVLSWCGEQARRLVGA
jgi:hypothetical protein